REIETRETLRVEMPRGETRAAVRRIDGRGGLVQIRNSGGATRGSSSGPETETRPEARVSETAEFRTPDASSGRGAPNSGRWLRTRARDPIRNDLSVRALGRDALKQSGRFPGGSETDDFMPNRPHRAKWSCSERSEDDDFKPNQSRARFPNARNAKPRHPLVLFHVESAAKYRSDRKGTLSRDLSHPSRERPFRAHSERPPEP